jgi:hypothetical protein
MINTNEKVNKYFARIKLDKHRTLGASFTYNNILGIVTSFAIHKEFTQPVRKMLRGYKLVTEMRSYPISKFKELRDHISDESYFVDLTPLGSRVMKA